MRSTRWSILGMASFLVLGLAACESNAPLQPVSGRSLAALTPATC